MSVTQVEVTSVCNSLATGPEGFCTWAAKSELYTETGSWMKPKKLSMWYLSCHYPLPFGKDEFTVYC